MIRNHCLVILVILVITGYDLFAQDTTKSAPNIDGTYRLVSRFQVTDSSTVTPPDIQGLVTYSNGYANITIAWRDQNGLVFSTAWISKYSLTDSTFTETMLYGYVHDEIHSQPVRHFFEPQTKTVPITREGTRISFKLPFDPPTQTFDGDKLVSTVKGLFVDTFERVK